ncbi:MAG TPA: hypothetical protein VFE62_21625 [Gemmataceae bacterium]|nr:hypothetical protein [Gemmataceae bacterium]
MQFSLVAVLLVVAQVPADREPHPLAPSLPRLTKAESRQVDDVIERLILADIGKLRGEDAKKANADFNKLGPESIFNLIDGLNRAANMESSCPAVLIAKKVGRILTTSNDLELLQFAKENIGAGVTAKRHLNVLNDLQSAILFRKATVQRSGAATKSLSAMSIYELEKAIPKQRGPALKATLTEVEKRNGMKSAEMLINGISATDVDIAKLSRELLAKNMKHQSGADLKKLLKHDRKEARIGAAGAIGARKLRFGAELIDLLQDGDDDVRQAGRSALKQIFGVDHGPVANASFGDRESSIARWRAWWKEQK